MKNLAFKKLKKEIDKLIINFPSSFQFSIPNKS